MRKFDSTDLLITYCGIIFGIWIFSLFKSIILAFTAGINNNDFFCPELIIAIIITQTFMVLANKKIYIYDSYLKASLTNIVLTAIAWGFGTSSGARTLASHPSHMLIKILMGLIC